LRFSHLKHRIFGVRIIFGQMEKNLGNFCLILCIKCKATGFEFGHGLILGETLNLRSIQNPVNFQDFAIEPQYVWLFCLETMRPQKTFVLIRIIILRHSAFSMAFWKSEVVHPKQKSFRGGFNPSGGTPRGRGAGRGGRCGGGRAAA